MKKLTPKADELVLTARRWYPDESCPGDWMVARMDDLARAVTAVLGSSPITRSGFDILETPLEWH